MNINIIIHIIEIFWSRFSRDFKRVLHFCSKQFHFFFNHYYVLYKIKRKFNFFKFIFAAQNLKFVVFKTSNQSFANLLKRRFLRDFKRVLYFCTKLIHFFVIIISYFSSSVSDLICSFSFVTHQTRRFLFSKHRCIVINFIFSFLFLSQQKRTHLFFKRHFIIIKLIFRFSFLSQ